MSDVTIPGGKIRAFVERIENLDSQIQELNEQKKEVFAEAKGDGFDVKILKEIVKLRKQDEEERDEREGGTDLHGVLLTDTDDDIADDVTGLYGEMSSCRVLQREARTDRMYK